MTYEEAREYTPSKAQARHEIMVKHCLDQAAWQAFIDEYGDHATYHGGDVFDFLGY